MRWIAALIVVALVPSLAFARPGLKLESWKWRADRIGNTIIEGVIKNESGKECSFCKIHVMAYDKKDEWIGSCSTYTEMRDLPAGLVSPFTCYLNQVRVKGNELKIKYVFE